MTLDEVTEGELHVRAEKIFVRATYPGKLQAKDHWVEPSAIEPADIDRDRLEGAKATVVWDLAHGRPRRVVVDLPPIEVTALDAKDSFLNPYAFISIPDRAGLPPELCDAPPASHDRYLADRWSGCIEMSIRTLTPLLIPDHAAAAVTAAPTGPPPALPVRLDHRNRPVLAGSAVKGMLRSAYEALTNSRFGVFTGHDRRLAVRANADEDVTKLLRPAIVTGAGQPGEPVTISWQRTLRCPCRKCADRPPPHPAVLVPIALPTCAGQHADWRGRQVDAWIYLIDQGKLGLGWCAAAYADPGQLGDPPPLDRLASIGAERGPKERKDNPRGRKGKERKGKEIVPGHRLVKVRGRLHWTGSTFPAGGVDKRYERMVVEEVLSGDARPEIRHQILDVNLVDGWHAVIDSYARAHEREPEQNRRSSYGSYVNDPNRWHKLEVGDTLYVELNNAGAVTGLCPAMIGRKPYPGAPEVSLPPAHRPATERDQLSPADRVFGWVRQGADDGAGAEAGPAHRGHLRVLPPHGTGIPDAGSVQHLVNRLRLVTLNSPKPEQFRFYLGDRDGSPLDRQTQRRPENGYPAQPGERRLRGRKVYLTHAEVVHGREGADAYWTPTESGAQLTLPGGVRRYREYQAPTGAKDAVTTSVNSWVKADTTFRVTLQVDNLSPTELGALLWLLSLPDGCALKLGLGKPLGFGAVQVRVDWSGTRLYTGASLLDRYRTLALRPEPTAPGLAQRLVEEYDELLRAHLPRVRAEFRNAARGFTGLPVHYPRARRPELPGDPHQPRATTYDWWVDNERVPVGHRRSLGTLADPDSLPLPYVTQDAEKDKSQRPNPSQRTTTRQPAEGRGQRSRSTGRHGR